MKFDSTLTDISNKDRFFTYLWFYEGWGTPKCKFGDVWVKAGEDAIEECKNRVRASAGVLKEEFDSGRCPIVSVWDASLVAKKLGKFKIHGKVDISIADECLKGFRLKDDLYTLSAEDAEFKINKYLAKVGQPLPKCGLAVWQYRSVVETIKAFENGCVTVLSDKCPRAGKTLYVGAVVLEAQFGLTIVSSYVLTSFTSFKNDLSQFEQFKDIVLVDAQDDDYLKQVSNARNEKKQVIVFLSLCKGGSTEESKRDKRIKALFSREEQVLLVVDEADYGAWKSGQIDPLLKHRNDDDCVILMTGTNSDRAVGGWEVDEVIQVTYLEMLMEKKVKSSHKFKGLSNFVIDTHRHDLVVDVQFYQMDLRSAVEAARRNNPELFIEDGKFLPSWSKFAKNPLKAQGFFTRILESIFAGKHGHDELNIDIQTNGVKSTVSMMFLPGNTQKKNLLVAADIAQKCLPNFKVVLLSGVNGTTNKAAESKAKAQIELARKEGKNVLILSSCMAQRSFSVGEINTVFLAYDNGEAGATIQKISRGLTPSEVGKIGRIVSLSFDPTRDDKLDALILTTAVNYQKSHDLVSVKEALRLVLSTIDIFSCTNDGAIKIDVDSYLNEIVNRERISKVIGKVADIGKLTVDMFDHILNSNWERYVPAAPKTEKGNTYGDTRTPRGKKAKGGNPSRKDDITLVREKIVALCENLDIVVLGTNSENMTEALEVLRVDKELRSDFEEEAGMPYEALKSLIDNGVINKNLLDLIKW